MAELYRRHHRAVEAAVGRVLFDQASSEDVVQDVFISLWRHPHGFDPTRGQLRAYLMAVGRNRGIDMARADRSRAAREAHRSAEARSERGAFPDVEEVVLANAATTEVCEALWSLTSDKRDAVVLAFFGGRTYRQVASDLGLPEGTVKSQIRSGLRQLAAALANDDAPTQLRGRRGP